MTPEVLNAGANLVWIDAQHEGSGCWIAAKPEGHELKVSGGFGRIVDDPSRHRSTLRLWSRRQAMPWLCT